MTHAHANRFAARVGSILLLVPFLLAARPLVEDTAPASIDGPTSEKSPLAVISLQARYPSSVFLPGLPDVGLFDPASSLTDTDETQLIQLVYDTYSRYSANDDEERVEFELAGFRTVYRPEFGHVAYYPELMSLTSPWKLVAEIRGQQTDDEPREVRYIAEWTPGLSLEDRPDMKVFLGMSALDMIGRVAEEHPLWRRTVAITSYRVKLSYLGRVHTYRAGFVWMLNEENDLEFSIVDVVVPQISFAVLERDMPTKGRKTDSYDRPLDLNAAGSSTDSCTAQSWPTVTSTQQTKFNSFEHNSGRHEAVYIGEFDCSCDSSCLSRCDPGFMVDACQEYGSLIHLGKLHEATKRSEIASGTSQMGQSESARCASGMGCFVTSCIAGSCGGSTIELSGGVGGLSFTTSSPTVLDASMTHSHLCGLCTETPDPGTGTDPDPCNPGGIMKPTTAAAAREPVLRS